MIKTLVIGWFLISEAAPDGGQYNYYLYDAQKNMKIAASLEKPFSQEDLACYDDDFCYVKLKMKVSCEEVRTYPTPGSKQPLITYYCNADAVKHLPCTERNSMVVGGRRYC